MSNLSTKTVIFYGGLAQNPFTVPGKRAVVWKCSASGFCYLSGAWEFILTEECVHRYPCLWSFNATSVKTYMDNWHAYLPKAFKTLWSAEYFRNTEGFRKHC